MTATGMRTEMGRIAGLLKETHDEATPLQRELDRTGKLLGVVVIAIAVVMIATIVLVEDVRGLAAIVDVLILGVALAVAAVPEGLPAVVTAVLSIGVQRMARRNAIVRHLAAVETLGSASVIASDKTGTLTKNEMTVRVVVTASGRVSFGGSGYAPYGEVRREDGGAVDGALRAELERALAAADRANNAVRGTARRPLDRAGRSDRGRAARRGAQGRPAGRRARRAVAARRRGAVLLRAQADEHGPPRRREPATASSCSPRARPTCCWRAAPASSSARSGAPLTPNRRAEILRANEALADEALRTLGVAARWLPDDASSPPDDGSVDERVEQDLVVRWPDRHDRPAARRGEATPSRARGRAGIRPLMITGDHPRTAAVIARELGIAGRRARDDRRGARAPAATTRSSGPWPRCRSTPA